MEAVAGEVVEKIEMIEIEIVTTIDILNVIAKRERKITLLGPVPRSAPPRAQALPLETTEIEIATEEEDTIIEMIFLLAWHLRPIHLWKDRS